MNLSRIAWYLEHLGLGETGKDIFVYQMPYEIERGILIFQSMPSRVEPYIPDLRRGSFQIVVRGLHPEEVRLRATEISDNLTIKGIRMSDMAFRHITPAHEPLVFPVPESRYCEASVNFDYVYSIRR